MRPIKCFPVVLPGTARPAGREKGESIKEREYEKSCSWVHRVLVCPVFSSAFIWDLKKSSIRSFWLPNFLGCFFRFSKISECCTSFKAEIQLNLAIFIWNIFSGTSINTTIFLASRTIQCELYHVRIRFFCCRWSCYRLQVHSTPRK